MQVNPQRVLDEKIVIPCEFTKVQQVGIDLSTSQDIVLYPGTSINILLNETIKLPIDMFATFHQRSTYSRKGVFVTTGIYDPAYEGSLGCTVYNLGPVITIPRNERIGQLVVFKADAASAYAGQWMNK